MWGTRKEKQILFKCIPYNEDDIPTENWIIYNVHLLLHLQAYIVLWEYHNNSIMYKLIYDMIRRNNILYSLSLVAIYVYTSQEYYLFF